MRILVTGGTGVVGRPAVDRLLERGHTVRLLSRHAEKDARVWEGKAIETRSASVGDAASLRGVAEGCDAVLHVAGVVAEDPPEVTFERVNVQGTANLVAEAARAGVRRFVYVSSLGAERGESGYHRSKRAAEERVRDFPGSWLVLRPGNVYGPGDEVISMLLKMVRTLPAVPTVGGGDQPFQPVSAEDLAEVLVLAVERDEPSATVLDVAGPEVVTTAEVLDLLSEVTGRTPPRLPVPEWAARLGAQVAEGLGVDFPVKGDQLTMLVEGNVIRPGGRNALTEFGVSPTPLRAGLAALAESLPELLPSDGMGTLHRQRYWADVRGSRLDHDALFELVCAHFDELTPEGLLQVGVEPGSDHGLREGNTLSLQIPLRGIVQVRVEEVADRAATAVTLEGHPLSGVIRFMVRDADGLPRFEIRSYTRSSNVLDTVAMATLGRPLQGATWRSVVTEVVRRSGGEPADGVHSETRSLSDEQAEHVERWVEGLVVERQKAEAEG